MNKTFDEGVKLTEEICASNHPNGTTVVLYPPFIHLQALRSIVNRHSWLHLGAQNLHQAAEGAYTGEISAAQLRSVGVDYVLVGHSERRAYFNESNRLMAQKIKAATAQGLRVMLCCGEDLEVRRKGAQNDYIQKQITETYDILSSEERRALTLVYEPIWAIGTGQTATVEQAEALHSSLRAYLCDIYAEAAETPILYGGSVKPANAAELLTAPNIDGLLVGGASLSASDFRSIIQASERSAAAHS